MEADDVGTISVDALRQLLGSGSAVTVLDVRTAAARSEWAIPGSLHVDAYEALRADRPEVLDAVRLPEDRPVVTVCNAGRTSRVAARHLRKRGVRAVSLEGGMKAWSLAWNAAEVPVPGSPARVLQVRRTGKGCLSYIIDSAGRAAVIDAALDPAVYLELASRWNCRVATVLETHVHADHLSRSRALAERTGASFRLPEQRRVSFRHESVRDGETLSVGASTLVALRVPGHTFESTGYLLDGRVLFTGDTLFLGGVGRPDLAADPEEAGERARALYRSLQRILTLAPDTIVLPAHTNEPVAFDNEPLCETLATISERVDLLKAREEGFVAVILSRLPPTPPNHRRIIDLNEAGLLPEGDPTDLEAGANRCAVS